MRGVERFGPLRERPFRLLWLGQTGSFVGSSLIPVALLATVLSDLRGGTWGVSLVLVSNFVGGAAVTLVGGVWADRLPRRAVLISADLVRIGTQTTTAVLLFDGTLKLWQLAVLQGIAGAAGGFFNPASTALVPQTVSAGLLQKANALLSLSRSFTSIFGPFLAGAIIYAAGTGWVFTIDAASFLFSVIFVAAMHVEAEARTAGQRFWQDLGDGWREVRRHRWLTAGFVGFALGNVGIGMFRTVGGVAAFHELGGTRAWAFILGSVAAGGVLGGVLSYRIRPRHPVAMAFAIWSLGALPLFALVRPFPLVVVMATALVLGSALIVGNTLWETAMQQEVRPDRLARVASIDILLSICLMPAGMLLGAPLQHALGIDTTLVLAGALMCVPNLLVVAFVREVRVVERRDDLEPAIAAAAAGSS